MKAMLESTTKVVTFRIGGAEVQARIWEGTTEGGVPFHAYITRVAVAESEDDSQFQAELQSHKPPAPEIAAIPLRLIL